MRTLEQSLQDEDLGRFRVIAELWGLDPPTSAKGPAVAAIVKAMAEPERAQAIYQALPPTSQGALQQLLAEGGKLPWADFTQRHGQLRQMGPGRRDREKPWRDPISDTERLLYYGFIARAFADTAVGAKEFAYVPTELQSILPATGSGPSAELGRATGRPRHVIRTSSGLVDDATTLLASLRRRPATERLSTERQRELQPFLVYPTGLPMLVPLLRQLGLLQPSPLTPDPAEVGRFLAEPRAEALRSLTEAWRASTEWNDLELLGHLEPGPIGWPNDPHAGRTAALELVARIPVGVWWDLESFVADVRELYPSFLRPGGDFESWYLRDRRTGAYLRGLDSWDAVDGSLLRALLGGPLHWLGAVDLGGTEPEGHPDRIRLTAWAPLLWDGNEVPALDEPAAAGRVHPDGRLELSRAAPRDLRYQLARLCSWLDFDGATYRYRLRPSGVLATVDQGLQPRHVHQLLSEVAPEPLPPRLLKALDRLATRGIEARLQPATTLRLSDSTLLDQLIEGQRTGALILERLGPTAALVRDQDVDELVRAAAESGLLIEPPGAN